MEAGTLIIGILSALGLGSIGGAVVMALANRRKLGSDAAKVITEAAEGVVKLMETRMEAAQTEHDRKVERLRAKVDRILAEWAREREDVRKVLQLHVSFDLLAIAKLAETGVDLGMEPPPLMPPIRVNLEELGEL